jgi:hypothetical protein
MAAINPLSIASQLPPSKLKNTWEKSNEKETRVRAAAY